MPEAAAGLETVLCELQHTLKPPRGARDDEALGSDIEPADFCPIMPPRVRGKYKKCDKF